MPGNPDPTPDPAVLPVRVERFVYGGFGLAHVAATPSSASPTLLVPFALPGELVEVLPVPRSQEAVLQQVLEPSPHRVTPGCPHFGICGGCHLQMASYPEQLRLKREVLLDSLRRANVIDLPAPEVHSGEPWGYRNRIRLRLERGRGRAPLRLHPAGRRRAASANTFLPITSPALSPPHSFGAPPKPFLPQPHTMRNSPVWLAVNA